MWAFGAALKTHLVLVTGKCKNKSAKFWLAIMYKEEKEMEMKKQ